VLDVGCGIMNPTTDLICKSILGVDMYKPYLEKIKEKHQTIRLNAKELKHFINNSYDVVIALDLIEHLHKNDAIKLLLNMRRIARKHAIIFTPKSFHTNEENTKNVWDMGKNTLQRHQCLVTKPELGKYGFVRVKTASYPNMVLAIST